MRILKSQNFRQDDQWEQESCRPEGMGCPCVGVPVAGPAGVFHIVVGNRVIVWFSAVHLWIADLTERKEIVHSMWFLLKLLTLTHHRSCFSLSFMSNWKWQSKQTMWPDHVTSPGPRYSHKVSPYITLAFHTAYLSIEAQSSLILVSHPLLTASACLRTRRRLFPSAAFTSPSVHPLLSSSATSLGTLDTSSRPSGSLAKAPLASGTCLRGLLYVQSSTLTWWRRHNRHQNRWFPLQPPSWCVQSDLRGEQWWRGEPRKEWRMFRWMLLTCNVWEFGRLLAGHVVVVEVDHDDSFFFFLQRWTEEETLTDLETLMYGMEQEPVTSALSGRGTYSEPKQSREKGQNWEIKSPSKVTMTAAL